MTDLRTPQQKLREKRAKKVCSMFSRLRSTSDNSNTVIIEHIANKLSIESPEYAITTMGIRYILKKEKLI